MSVKAKKNSAIPNDMVKITSYAHPCAGDNIGLYFGSGGTVDLTTTQGTVLTGITVSAGQVFAMQVKSVEASTSTEVYELIQAQ